MAEITLPGEIERQSMKIIAGELEDRGICLSEEYRPVVHRVIHATADFDFADSLTFTDHAVSLSVKALQEGTAIVTDTNMAKAGISSVALRRLHTEVHCLMADPLIAERAKQTGTTRAVAAMHASSERYSGAVYAIGNAPTALLCLAEKIENGLRPDRSFFQRMELSYGKQEGKSVFPAQRLQAAAVRHHNRNLRLFGSFRSCDAAADGRGAFRAQPDDAQRNLR